MASCGGDREREFETTLDAFEYYTDEIQKLQAECTSFSFLAAGKTGAGKSTLLNALTNTKEFNSNPDRSCAGTTIITKYEFQRNGVNITAWDSPGFQDSSGEEERYKMELRDNCSNVDLLIYCISLKEVRSDLGDDSSALKQITEALTKDVWKKSVIVLTCANKCESRLTMNRVPNLEVAFNEKIAQWKHKVKDALLHAGVDESTINELPVIPAGHVNRKHLPGHKLWLSELWLTVYSAVRNEEAQLALNNANIDRFISPEKEEKASGFLLVIAVEKLVEMVQELVSKMRRKRQGERDQQEQVPDQ